MVFFQKVDVTVSYRLPNFCAQQCIDDDVGLCIPHNLHRTDHMKNGGGPCGGGLNSSLCLCPRFFNASWYGGAVSLKTA